MDDGIVVDVPCGYYYFNAIKPVDLSNGFNMTLSVTQARPTSRPAKCQRNHCRHGVSLCATNNPAVLCGRKEEKKNSLFATIVDKVTRYIEHATVAVDTLFPSFTYRLMAQTSRPYQKVSWSLKTSKDV